MSNISILGCGWLGFPLARYLLQSGFCVNGSTTTREKISFLKEAGIAPFLVNCDPYVDSKEIQSFFDSAVLFLNIPFRRNLENPYFYKWQIDSVISFVEKSNIGFVIFAGTTAIYPDSLKEALENQPVSPESPRARVLCEVEKALLDNKHFDSTIIRFAGMYGGARKIGRFLSGKKDLGGAESPANLIHLDDCVKIVAEIIRQDIRGEVFNACSDGHPSKKELYMKAALALGVEPPKFMKNEHGSKKVVSNKKLKEFLDYTFKYSDPIEYLEKNK